MARQGEVVNVCVGGRTVNLDRVDSYCRLDYNLVTTLLRHVVPKE